MSSINDRIERLHVKYCMYRADFGTLYMLVSIASYRKSIFHCLVLSINNGIYYECSWYNQRDTKVGLYNVILHSMTLSKP